MREVITLQLGQTANYVGTHFWNTQEEYFSYGSDDDNKSKDLDHDVLYRAGVTPTGIETYTPRVLVYDLKGGFGSLQKYNRLFSDTGDSSKNIAWDQGVNTVVSEPYAKNTYQQQLDNDDAMDVDASYDLDTTVHNWSDFNRIFYHPRSMNQITTHHMDDTIMPFDAYPVGKQSYKDFERETETFDDNFRFFAEECDNLQGFQVLAGVDDAFGGFTEGLLRDLKEEYPKASIVIYGLQSSNLPNKERARQVMAVNRGISLARLSDLSTLYIPLYTPSPISVRSSGLSPCILPNCNLLYHTSAIISAAIETVSLTFRMNNNPVSMADLGAKMSSQESIAIAGLSISLPLPFLQQGFDATLEQFKNTLAPLLDLSKSQFNNQVPDAFVEDVIVRGLPHATVSPNSQSLFNYVQALYHKFPRSEPRFLDYIPYPLPSSFPKFFTPAVGVDGLLSPQPRSPLEAVQSVPLLTRMYTGPELVPEIAQIIKQFENAPFRQLTEYSEGFSQTEYLETKEDLWRLHDAFSI